MHGGVAGKSDPTCKFKSQNWPPDNKISKGLDEVHLFDDTGAVAIILEEAEIMLASGGCWPKACWANMGFYLKICYA